MKWKLTIFSSIFLAIVLLSLLFVTLRAPVGFPEKTLYTVEKGSGLNRLALDLKNKQIIKSSFWFKSLSVLFGGTKGIMAGDYVFEEKHNTLSIAYRISRGDFKLIPIKITIAEGLNVYEISKIVSQKFSKIDSDYFVKLASQDEGYLFPDTYFFLPNASAEDIIAELKANFQNRIKPLEAEILAFNKPLTDIIKLASIVEEEARTIETRQIISGILWKRLSLGMPLQVDASFKYINGKGTKDLTLADLKIDSPYNSYLYKGLPPTPIANPGLESIKATITPIKTEYLYFLSDKNGEMHYAVTYATHLQNKELYLE